MYTVKDSGNHQTFQTGAKRDTTEGKPDLALLSPYVWGVLLSHPYPDEVQDYILDQLGLWVKTGNVEALLDTLTAVDEALSEVSPNGGAVEITKVLEAGARKYSAWNWAKGIPVSRTLSSALRHYVAWVNDVEDGEDHLAHLGCNLMFLIHTQMGVERGNLPRELLDLPVFENKGENNGS